MTHLQRRISVTALGSHLLIVALISLQDFSSTLASAPSLLPPAAIPSLRWVAAFTATLMNQPSSGSSLMPELLAGYAGCAGIESGYSYFAPNVPGNTKLAFELTFPDKHVEYDVPVVSSAAAGYRISTLLDHLHAVTYLRLREALVADLVSAVRKEHPGATRIRAVFGVADLTTVPEYRAGKRNSYHVLYAYEFNLRPGTATPITP